MPKVLLPCRLCGTSAASGLKFCKMYAYKARFKALSASKIDQTF